VTAPHDPEIARVWRRLDPVLSLLDEQAGRITADSFVATHPTGTVEAAVNGRMRLTDLRIDPRILSLGADEVAGRINETIGTAIDYVVDVVDREVRELTSRVTDALADLDDPPPPN
jgi:DNA-binding protein YbaB